MKNITKTIAALTLLAFALTVFASDSSAQTNLGGIRNVLQKYGMGSEGGGAQSAKTGTVRVNTALNVRTGPWAAIIGALHNGDRVEIVGQEGEWYKIKYNGQTAFVHSDYVDASSSSGPSASQKKFTGTVTARSGLNVRSAPWGPIIGLLSSGAKVSVTGKSGEWYTISYNGGRAFVHSDYVSDSAAAPQTPSQPQPQPDNPPVSSAGGYTFPVTGYCSFSDASYSCHAGGGSPFNKGVDIFGAIGLHLVACRNGKISNSFGTDPTGGNRLHVIDSDGNDYYYAHMNGFASVRPGMSVSAGTTVGFLGKTGNAINTDAHLHFSQVRNGQSINPTSWLRAAKGK